MSEETSGGGIPEGYGTVTPWLISRDSADLIHFLGAAFGAGEIAGSRMHNPDGSIAHLVASEPRYRRPRRPDADADGRLGMVEAMRYVQQTFVDALREQAERRD